MPEPEVKHALVHANRSWSTQNRLWSLPTKQQQSLVETDQNLVGTEKIWLALTKIWLTREESGRRQLAYTVRFTRTKHRFIQTIAWFRRSQNVLQSKTSLINQTTKRSKDSLLGDKASESFEGKAEEQCQCQSARKGQPLKAQVVQPAATASPYMSHFLN
jgi:hypothetical protein